MSRARILWLGALLGTLGVALSLGSTGYLAWMLVLRNTHERLELLADFASRRAQSTFDEAASALISLADSDLSPCSDAGIEQMRLLAINTYSVKSVGYVEEEVFACSSWGQVGKSAAPWATDFVTPNGISVSLQVKPRIAPGKSMMALQYAAFNVMLDPEQFYEVYLDQGVGLAVGTTNGKWIKQPSEALERVLTRVHHGPHSGLTEGFVYTRVDRGNWQAVAAVSRSELLQALYREELLLLPFGAALAGLCLLLTVRQTRARLSPLRELTQGVRERQFTAHYQPIIDLRDGRCVGVEALLRWQRPEGTLLPCAFIELAEQSGLIRPMTDQLIAAVVRDLSPVLSDDAGFHVSINLAPEDVSSGRYLPVLDEVLAGSPIPPERVWLEVTESSLVNLDAARDALERARQRGYRIALDDFGTGYSSLQYLDRLPLDLLKIDRSFVQQIGNSSHCPITLHTIALARHLHLETVAEGIETMDQLSFLLEHGVQFGQGWLFGKAMAISDLREFLRRPLS